VKRSIKSHRSPLHELAFIYDITPDDYETITPVQSKPKYENKFNSSGLCGMRQNGYLQSKDIRGWLNGKAGAAVVLY